MVSSWLLFIFFLWKECFAVFAAIVVQYSYHPMHHLWYIQFNLITPDAVTVLALTTYKHGVQYPICLDEDPAPKIRASLAMLFFTLFCLILCFQVQNSDDKIFFQFSTSSLLISDILRYVLLPRYVDWLTYRCPSAPSERSSSFARRRVWTRPRVLLSTEPR
jgi:hypothetical protein